MKHLRIAATVLTELLLCAVTAQQLDSLTMARMDSAYRASQDRFSGHMFAKSFFDGNTIHLRWGADTPGAWINGNVKGYAVERVDLGRSGDALDSTGWVPVSGSPRIPLDIPGWETLHDQYPKDNYIMLAGGMIHDALDPANIGFNPDMRGANELFHQRYSFTMLAADLSFEAAEGAALGFKDNNVTKGNDYMYRIYIPGLKHYPVDTAFVFVTTAKADSIFRPEIRAISEHDNAVTLAWDRGMHTPHFTAYYMERSSDGGKNFKRLNELPYVGLKNPDIAATEEEINYLDSLPKQYVPHQYRLVGTTPFGMESPPSRVVKAMARDKTGPPSPTAVKATEKGQSQLNITWEYPKNIPDLKGFYVLRTNDEYGDYTLLTKEPLKQTVRSYLDKEPPAHLHNYYLVVALDTAMNPGISLSAWGTIADSIAPAAPKGLAGTVDSSGVVTLTWNLGKEVDLYGYYVFRKNQADHVGARVSPFPIRDTTFTDTITMRTTTEKVYYEIVALDVVRNNSDPSKLLELKRPDLRVPTSPLMVDYRVSKEGIWIKWANSSSADVVEHVLLRRKSGEVAWDTLQRYPVAKEPYTTFMNKDQGGDGKYEFGVVARDDDGLWSPMANSFKLRLLSRNKPPTVQKLKVNYNAQKKVVELKWEYDQREGIVFVVMKAEANGSYSRVKMLKNDLRSWNDRLVKPAKEYRYFIQVVDPNGQDSDHSESVNVRL